MRGFVEKTVVITGGATGIGFSLAKQFRNEGANVVIGSLRADRLQQAGTELASLGVKARHFVCDVTSHDDVEALADVTWREFGQVDSEFGVRTRLAQLNSTHDRSPSPHEPSRPEAS